MLIVIIPLYLHYHVVDKNNKDDLKLLNMILTKKLVSQTKKESEVYNKIYSDFQIIN